VTLPPHFAAWFVARGWQPRAHQLAMLDAAAAGESALLVATTGGRKTLAGFLPSLVELAADPRPGHARVLRQSAGAGDPLLFSDGQGWRGSPKIH